MRTLRRQRQAKRPKQTAEEVCFSGDKLTTLLFQSLCLQVKAEAQAVSVHLLTSRDAASGPVAARGWDDPAGATLMKNPLDPLGRTPGLLTPD